MHKNADFYLRKPIGPGYLLLGDAGCRKHFVSGQGMTEAFIEARNISKAILIDTEAGYRRYWKERDSRVVPLYLDAKFQSNIEKINTYFIRKLFSELAKKTEYANRLTMSCNRVIKPKAVFTVPMLLKSFIKSLYTCDARFIRDLMIYITDTFTSDLRDELLIRWRHAARWKD
ncbi:MAG: hypothetical protein B0W54_21450 [Cellvibrio sp. 79]|nr:MAG: hypothetical protein B0W54_21450 [Cellvibrio sp. 79]